MRVESSALAPALGLGEDSDDEDLLRVLAARFTSYYAVKRWLEENGVPSSTVFESWA